MWYKKKDYAKAIADYTEAIKIDPKWPGDYIMRGNAYDDDMQYDKAIADYKKALELDPKQASAYRESGVAKKKHGDYEGAIADFTKVLELAPEDSDVNNDLAWLFATCPGAGQRDGTQAVMLATKACELTQFKEANYIDTLAAAYAEAGDFDKAVETQKKALALIPESNKSEKKEFEDHLKLFESKTPFHLPPIVAGN